MKTKLALFLALAGVLRGQGFGCFGNCGDGDASGSGLTVDGWYLKDGSSYYAGPHMAPMTLPSAAAFSWVNQGGATETANGGALFLTVANANETNLRIRTMSMGANTTLTAHFAVSGPFANNATAGIGFRESATGKLIPFQILLSPNLLLRVEISAYTNPTTWNGSAYNSGVLGGAFNWIAMRLVYTAGSPGTVAFQISNDDRTWATLYTANANAHLTTAPDQWFYFVDGNSATAGSTTMALYSWKAQ